MEARQEIIKFAIWMAMAEDNLKYSEGHLRTLNSKFKNDAKMKEIISEHEHLLDFSSIYKIKHHLNSIIQFFDNIDR